MRLTTLFLIAAFAASTVSADSVLQSSSGDADSGESHDLTIYNSSDEGVYIWVVRPDDVDGSFEENSWGCFDEESPCWSGYVPAGDYRYFSEPTFLNTALYICDDTGAVNWPACTTYQSPIMIYATTDSYSSKTPPGSLNISVEYHPGTSKHPYPFLPVPEPINQETAAYESLKVDVTSGSWSHSLQYWGSGAWTHSAGADCGNALSPGGCVAGELHFNGATSSFLTDPEVPEPTTLLLVLLALVAAPLRVRCG